MQEPPDGVKERVGIHVETTSFAVTPGDRVAIPITLTNHGLERDVLNLAVDGIPSSWVYASSPSTPLNPGQAQEISLTIQPSQSLQAGAGRHPFRIQATSHLDPGQVFEVTCVLTIAASSAFSSELRPQRVQDGEPARVTVENRGNMQQSYTLTCISPNNALTWEPGPSQELLVSPGQVALAEFRASPRNRPVLGGEVTFPFTARVQSADLAVRNHTGEVVSRALIPNWVIPVVLVLIVAASCVAALLIFGPGILDGAPAAPAATSAPGDGQPIPTELPSEVPPTVVPGASPTVVPEQLVPTEPPPEVPTEAPPAEPTPEAKLPGLRVFGIGVQGESA